MDFAGFQAMLKDDASIQAKTKMSYDEIRTKLIGAKPQLHGTTKTSATGNVAGMTDASKYTGAHKERFDKDGKGKGIEGREEVADTSGYVGNYTGKGTYDDKKH